jgi:hypothetical protein
MIETRSKGCQPPRNPAVLVHKVFLPATPIEGDATFDKKPGES